VNNGDSPGWAPRLRAVLRDPASDRRELDDDVLRQRPSSSSARSPMACCSRALVGKFAKHKVSSGLGEKLGDALPPGRRASSRSMTERRPTWSPPPSSAPYGARRPRSTVVAPRTSRPAWPRRRPGWAAA